MHELIMDQILNLYTANVHPYINPITDTLIKVTAHHPWISTLTFLGGTIVIYYYASRPRNLPPGPIGLPFIGSPCAITEDLPRDLNDLSKKWGDLFCFYIGWTPVVVLNSHKLIKEAFFKRGDEFSDRGDFNSLLATNYCDEIFHGKYSKDWLDRKKFIMSALKSHGFATNNIEDSYKANLEKFYDYIDSFGGAAFDPYGPISLLNTCTMAKISYGTDYKDLAEPELQFLCELNTDFVTSAVSFSTRFQFWKDNTPRWVTWLLEPWKVKTMWKSYQNYVDFLLKKISEHRKILDRQQPRDLIDSYLIERGDDPLFSDKQLATNIIATLIDTVDTAPILMAWVFLYLTSYPDLQKKIQDQIDSVCGGRRPGFADRAALPLVDATITEVGRLVSPVSLTFPHKPLKNTKLNGYTIPKKSAIFGNLWAANRDPEVFPRGDAFQPEAFIDENGRFMRSEKTMPFGTGRRSCLGELMTKNELFLLVSNTLQRYSLEFPEGPHPSLENYGGLFRIPEPFTIQAIKREH